MITRKNHNSILFLTTLGVYLGLVLVGATPRIVAQSAKQRQVLKENREGERPEVNFDDSVIVYLQDVESFIADLRKLRQRQKLDLVSANFIVAQSTQLPCLPSNRAGSYTAEKLATSVDALRPFLERYSKIFTDGYALPDCLETVRFPNLTATDSRFEITANAADFKVSVTARKASAQRAVELARLLPAVFIKFREDTSQSLRNQIIKATSIRARNDQVFVTTRLPRAALDSLLAIDVR